MSKIPKTRRTKTIESFINKWPEPYQTQAKENSVVDISTLSEWSAPIEVLQSLFVWGNSPQGGDYWNEFSTKYLTL